VRAHTIGSVVASSPEDTNEQAPVTEEKGKTQRTENEPRRSRGTRHRGFRSPTGKATTIGGAPLAMTPPLLSCQFSALCPAINFACINGPSARQPTAYPHWRVLRLSG
jgi:hypothetical protein